MDEDIHYKELALLNRAYMAEVWRKLNDNEDMTVEEDLLAEQMQAHPEYASFWEDEEMLEHQFDPEREENPFLHISLHVMLERQITSNNPSYVRAAVERLEARGEDPHEVRHALLRILVGEIWQVLSGKGPFNEKRYRREIEKL